MKKKMVETLKYCVKTVEYNSIFIAIGLFKFKWYKKFNHY